MDATANLLLQASTHDASAYGLAVMAGLATSIGPCVAPRYFALVTLTSTGTRRSSILRAAAFILGTLVGFLGIALAGSLVFRLIGTSAIPYWTMCIVLIVCGIRAAVDHVD